MFYFLHEGCQWRALPHDLPPWTTVSNYFRKWQRKGILSKIQQVESQISNLSLIWVDAGYTGPKLSRAVEKLTQATVEVVKRSSKAFEVLPRRWVVERTFAWLLQNRRLVVDSEKLPEISRDD